MLKIFTLFDVKMIQIWSFPADRSAERVAFLRHPINLRLFNWRVPALLYILYPRVLSTLSISYDETPPLCFMAELNNVR